MLELEKKERVDNENNLYKLIKEMHQKILGDIREEKKEREKTEATMVYYLEEACVKMEKTYNN